MFVPSMLQTIALPGNVPTAPAHCLPRVTFCLSWQLDCEYLCDSFCALEVLGSASESTRFDGTKGLRHEKSFCAAGRGNDFNGGSGRSVGGNFAAGRNGNSNADG